MYTNDPQAQIVLALLKKFNIKKIVISPGTTNVPLAGSVQSDPFFEVYSVVDERSAAYFATGLAFESGEPVVISCTGATASRNYLPALTEAYYRNLPIIAITSENFHGDYTNLQEQLVDRTSSQNDIKRISVHLPIIKDEEDERQCIFLVNKALNTAINNGGGPIHINLYVKSLFFDTEKLPDVPKIDYYDAEMLMDMETVKQLYKSLKGKKVALHMGAHRKLSPKEAETVERFIDSYDAAVFYDHTSNYHGKNKILTSVAFDLKQIQAMPDIVIDMGSVSGASKVWNPNLFPAVEFWRISEDGIYHQRFGKLNKFFDCSEQLFFRLLSTKGREPEHPYYREIKEKIGKVNVPELPLSNTLISSQIAKGIPRGSSLHMSILNSLRNMNFFELGPSIDSICNVGAFGIDGAVSTLVGQTMANKERLYFGLIGDLAFFYDMNALGIRHIENNLRILLVNNGRGVEFRLTPAIEMRLGEKIDEYIAAADHFTSARAWAESMGFHYMTAETKEGFASQMDDFFHEDVNHFGKPVVFEVFTKVEDEQKALELIRSANRPMSGQISQKAKEMGKKLLPEKAVKTLRNLRK